MQERLWWETCCSPQEKTVDLMHENQQLACPARAQLLFPKCCGKTALWLVAIDKGGPILPSITPKATQGESQSGHVQPSAQMGILPVTGSIRLILFCHGAITFQFSPGFSWRSEKVWAKWTRLPTSSIFLFSWPPNLSCPFCPWYIVQLLDLLFCLPSRKIHSKWL